MNLIERFITKNDCYRNNVNKADSRYTVFQTRGPVGLMLHSVGTPQSRAKVFADGWDVAGKDVAVHAVLQADGTVYQCLPWNFRGWHAGGTANNTHIGVEMTEPDQLRYTGGASFTVTDLAAARRQAEGCYRTAVDLFAKLCRDLSLSPNTIISHAEGARLGIASGHADPEHLWQGLGLGYTMDSFRNAVAAKLDGANHNEQEENEAMNKEQIISTLGDSYIRTFDELPEWAKPELREMLDLGLINGGTADDPNDINMLLSDLRVAIVAYRAFRMMEDKNR